MKLMPAFPGLGWRSAPKFYWAGPLVIRPYCHAHRLSKLIYKIPVNFPIFRAILISVLKKTPLAEIFGGPDGKGRRGVSGKNPIYTENDGVTYVAGLGFVPGNLGRPVAGRIRLLSNLLGATLLLDALCRRVFLLPFTYLAALFGLDITINYSTGMIVMSEETRLILRLAVMGFSLLIVFLLLRVSFHRAIRTARVFRRPQPGSLSLFLPILTAVGLLSTVLVYYLGEAVRACGIVLDRLPGSVYALDAKAAIAFVHLLAIGLLQTLIFQGAILTPLRRFGDGFAVLSSALLAAVWADGLVSAIFTFLFAVAAGYFVVRSGSVWTAVAGRLVLEALLFGFRVANGILESSLASVVILFVLIVSTAIALLSYLRFVKLDPRAFSLLPPDGPPPTPQRLSAFCSSLMFLLLGGMLVYRVISNLQLIGW